MMAPRPELSINPTSPRSRTTRLVWGIRARTSSLNSAEISAVSLPLQITRVDSGVAWIRSLKRELGTLGGLVDMKAPVLSGSAARIRRPPHVPHTSETADRRRKSLWPHRDNV